MAWSQIAFRVTTGVAAGLATLLAGCARYASRPLSPEIAAAEFESRSLNNPELRRFLEKNLQRELPDWPLTSWDFKTLTLVAFYYHPSLDLARAQWGVAKAGEITAGQRPNPTAMVGPGYNLNAASGVTPWLAFVDLDLPIETAGKRGYRLAQARHRSESAHYHIATVAWQVRRRLRAACFETSSAAQREQVLRRQVAIQESMVARIDSRQAAGVLARSDVVPWRITLEKSRLDLTAIQRQRESDRARVADALGVPFSALTNVALVLELPDYGELAKQLTTPEVRRLALHSRSDILAALADYAASQSALQLEIAKQYPDLHLNPGYEFDQGENKWILGLSMELPVRHQNQGGIAEAEARREAAAARFVALQARVMGDLDRALAASRLRQQQLTSLETLLAVQRQQQQDVQRRLDAGAAEQLDLLQAELEAGSGELTQLEAQIQYQNAMGDLEDALQLPLEYWEPGVLEQGRDPIPEPLP